MLPLYSLIFLMLIAALCILAIPFVWNNNKLLFSKSYLFTALFMSLLSLGLYQFSGNKIALQYWLTQGAQHYQLLDTFEQLGGVDGAIVRIEAKLQSNPNDAQGWLILGKLYLSKHEDVKAQQAFDRARVIENAREIK